MCVYVCVCLHVRVRVSVSLSLSLNSLILTDCFEGHGSMIYMMKEREREREKRDRERRERERENNNNYYKKKGYGGSSCRKFCRQSGRNEKWANPTSALRPLFFLDLPWGGDIHQMSAPKVKVTINFCPEVYVSAVTSLEKWAFGLWFPLEISEISKNDRAPPGTCTGICDSVLESGANSSSTGTGFDGGSRKLFGVFPKPDETAPGDRKIFPTCELITTKE